MLELVPELPPALIEALLPGAYTLVLPNPAQRFRWLTGSAPATIGVRVPELTGPAAEVLDRVGRRRGDEREPARRTGGAHARGRPGRDSRGRGRAVDGGELPGTPSTVLDLTGDEPRVLREGAVSAKEALERAAAAFGR